MGTNALSPFDTSAVATSINYATLFASLIWGGIGAGFAIYGKKQKSAPPWFGGLALVGISYFISSALWMSVTGVGIMAGIWFWGRYSE